MTIEHALRTYAKDLDDLVRDSMYNSYTGIGVLYTFLQEVRPLIEDEVRESLRNAPTAESMALHFAKRNGPDRWISAIKELRTWLRDNGEEYHLKRARDLIYAAYRTLGTPGPWDVKS